MKQLELKLPPVAVTALFAVAMWGIARVTPPEPLPQMLTFLAAALFTLGSGVVGIAGIAAFRRAGTTVNPLQPENSTALVVGGIYRYTRNPMYLGMVLVLLGCAVTVGASTALLVPPLFMIIIEYRFIRPEEAMLHERFPEAYAAYCARVRHWL